MVVHNIGLRLYSDLVLHAGKKSFYIALCSMIFSTNGSYCSVLKLDMQVKRQEKVFYSQAIKNVSSHDFVVGVSVVFHIFAVNMTVVLYR